MSNKEKEVEIKKGYTIPKPEEETIKEGYVVPPQEQSPKESPKEED